MHYKDQILDSLAERANVAQFVSFDPKLRQRFARISGYSANRRFPSVRAALDVLLRKSSEASVNIRSFAPSDSKSREFVYGVRNLDDLENHVRRLAESGLYTIANETIDVRDGGVSGVALGDLIEFAPDDTPRAVEKPGTAAFSRETGVRILEKVYGFRPALNFPKSARVEFSIHPLRRGVRGEHTIVWEAEKVGVSQLRAETRWPNKFSEMIGDKAFGLLVADALGLPVPRTTVISRRIATFSFGTPTGSCEPWLRTCPRVQTPGKFTTKRGWIDPFVLLHTEDPKGEDIASVLSQEGIDATYSGAALATATNRGPKLTVEGIRGFGDQFMVGTKSPAALPRRVVSSINQLFKNAYMKLGYVRFEWVMDLRQAWIVQMHVGKSPTSGRRIFPGNPRSFLRFEVKDGLEALRSLVENASQDGLGIALVGDVGVTSHFGDVLRRARVPSFIANGTHE
jgi:hypothetical protein